MKHVEEYLNKLLGRRLESFEKGDVIVRVKPKIKTTDLHNENLGISVEVKTGHDNSFMGDPVKFLGISQGMFYYSYTEGHFKEDINKAHLHEYDDDNWEIYEKPDFI